MKITSLICGKAQWMMSALSLSRISLLGDNIGVFYGLHYLIGESVELSFLIRLSSPGKFQELFVY